VASIRTRHADGGKRYEIAGASAAPTTAQRSPRPSATTGSTRGTSSTTSRTPWPDGWVKGYGYVRVAEEPAPLAEPRLLTEFGHEYVDQPCSP
jgi:hypothetical protein